MTDDERYTVLNSELGTIYEEVQDLRVKQHIFWEVQEIVRANSNINVPNEFYTCLEETYAASMSAAIRRQIDATKDTISFLRFLQAVEQQPTVVTRKRYRKFSTKLSEDEMNAHFDLLVGAGNNNLAKPAVQCDIQALRDKTDALKDYANSLVTHRAKNPAAGLASFRDIDAAIEGLEVLLKKYLNLFRFSVVSGTLLPVVIDNWKSIFRVPWIPNLDAKTSRSTSSLPSRVGP